MKFITLMVEVGRKKLMEEGQVWSYQTLTLITLLLNPGLQVANLTGVNGKLLSERVEL